MDVLDLHNKPYTVQYNVPFQEKIGYQIMFGKIMLIYVKQTWSKAVLFVAMLVLVNLGMCNTVCYTVYQKN